MRVESLAMAMFATMVIAASSLIDINAQAASYKCTEARDEATLTASGNVSTNHGDRKCRFTVDGASSSTTNSQHISGRIPEVTSALNALINGNLDNFSNSNFSQLQVLLLGPFEGVNISSSVRSSFENIVRSYSNEIGRCIVAEGSLDRQNFVCRNIMLAGRNRGESNNILGIEVTTIEPVLAIGIEIERQRYVTFMPRRLMQLGRARQFEYR